MKTTIEREPVIPAPLPPVRRILLELTLQEAQTLHVIGAGVCPDDVLRQYDAMRCAATSRGVPIPSWQDLAELLEKLYNQLAIKG